MTSAFSREKEVLDQLIQTSLLANRLKVALSEMILRRAQQSGSMISKELHDRCTRLTNENIVKRFPCKFCRKEFSDGRKLGGHVSRAHYGQRAPSNDSRSSSPNQTRKHSKSRSFRKYNRFDSTKKQPASDVYFSEEE